jgi:hypothetical protein
MNILVTSGSLRFSVIATSTGRLSLEKQLYALVAIKEEDCFLLVVTILLFLSSLL